MRIGHRVGKLAGKLRNLAFAGAATINLFGQVVWDDAPTAIPAAFKDDVVESRASGLQSGPARLILTRDSGIPKPGGDAVPAVSGGAVRPERRTEDGASHPVAQKNPTWKHDFGASGSETPALALKVAHLSIGRSVASVGLSGVVTPLPASNALPDAPQSQSSGNSLPDVVNQVNFEVNLEKQSLVSYSTPILAAPTPVWLAYYPFTGNSPASFDPDPLSTASSLVNIGLGYLKYNASIGNPAPALQLDAKDVPASFMLGAYLTFTITPNPGHVLNLDEFSFDIRAVGMSSPYTAYYQVRTSVDGFASAVVWGSVTSASGSFTTITTSLGPSFKNLGSIEFRMLFSDSNQGAVNYILVDNITVVGSTVLVPEPEESVVVAGLALVGLAAWRKISRG